MKISEIELTNFRNYVGKQKAIFTTLAGKNVTLIYGTNGGGKTTLLNAFTWALYGKLSPDLEDPETLINLEAWSAASAGEKLTVSVTVVFDHDGKMYRVTREQSAIKRGLAQELGKVEFNVRVTDQDGVSHKIMNPSGAIEKILPSRLSGFFFINGERIEQLAKPEAYSEIQSAIKTVVGIEPLERALKHLPKARNQIRHKLKSEETGDISIDKVNKEIDDLENQQEEAKDELDLLKSEIPHFKTELDSVNERLRSLEGVAELQKDRAQFERLRDDSDALLKELLQSRNQLVRQRGYMVFLSGMPEKITSVCKTLREQGQLPAPLKRTFVEDLLREAECICGTHLAEGSPQRQKIQNWLERAGLAEERSWMMLEGAMGGLAEQRKSAIEELEKLDVQIARCRKTLQEHRARIEEISSKIKKAPGEDPAKLEATRDRLLSEIEAKTKRLGVVQERISELDSLLKQKSALVERLEVKNAANRRVQQRIAVVREAEEALAKTRDLISERTRRSLDSRVRKVFEKSSVKDYVPELTSEFELQLWTGVGDKRRRAPKSTGENMLLSLSFVAALAEECRIVAEQDTHAMSDMSDFPVVLDAAFGNMDTDYRRRVADFLPKMASQVVVLTSKAQAEGAAEERLAPAIGRQYVITTHTRKSDVEEVTEAINVNGTDCPYQVVNSSFDGAVLMEVEA
ncbi:AAA family ATPase [Streptomyces chilikensis]|uniref:AAA family ATPase n=1 Tax=Streptomyces chilikensis TaxID=1194079 RepID=UPI000AF60160|nr:AAA family ATPase [Streptomyces chilikensis]